MNEDRSPKALEETAAGLGAAKQRKKRKWDQPAEPLISAAAAVPGVPSSLAGVIGVSLPGAVPFPAALLMNPVPLTYPASAQLVQSVSIPQSAATIVQKLIQPKIQDELIAREIVINDAESSVRYKLTKRQTQEEIQKFTGAVVITRGKYRPPNALPDGEKPLYLHISAGSNLRDTADRIKAVDRAASMVEEILKQGQNSLAKLLFEKTNVGWSQVAHPLSTSLFLGFDVDPSLNIAARIRGPNDQYINHIMNETGATVVLRGQESGNLDSCHAGASQQPLHLYLSSTNAKSLEAARALAENLLDTIAAECGASRIFSSKVYAAVPPPQQLLVGVNNSVTVPDVPSTLVCGLQSTYGSTSALQSFVLSASRVPAPVGSNTYPPGVNPPNNIDHAPPPLSGGTRYSGYEGIYPRATPLQQVALALIQTPASTASIASSAAALTGTIPKTGPRLKAETDNRPPQRRKFQELPVSAKGPTTDHQNSQPGSEFLKPGSEESGLKNISNMPPPKMLVEPRYYGMPLPPPRNMPPPPPKFMSHEVLPEVESKNIISNDSMPPPVPPKIESIPVPKFWSRQSPPKKTTAEKSSEGPASDTLLKLAEYGEDGEEDDDDI